MLKLIRGSIYITIAISLLICAEDTYVFADTLAIYQSSSGPVPPIVPRLATVPQRSSTSNQQSSSDATPTLIPLSDPAEPSISWSETENYLILGTDRRPEWDIWRTDTIMLLGVDRARNRAGLLSIPRDLYVHIPNYGHRRINLVDYLGEKVLNVEGGGPALLSAVLEETLGISTDHWIRIEMDGFETLVDAIGGVTVHLDCPFFEPILNLDTNNWEYFTLPAGEVLLDGEAAHWFVRLRLRESDIGRSRRQRQFLWALRDQALSTDLILRLPALWSALSELFTTDLSLLKIADLARFGVRLEPNNVRASGITLRDLEAYTTESGAQVLRIRDPMRVRAVVDGIWNSVPMSASNRQDNTQCKPIPQGAPSYIPDSVLATPQPNEDSTNKDESR